MEVETREEGVFRGTVIAEPPRLTIVRRWMLPRGASYVWAAWCVAMLGLAVVNLWASSLRPFEIGLGIVAVSAYLTGALFLNRTTITVADDILRIQHGPLPWPWMRAREIALDDIAGVWLYEVPEQFGTEFHVMAQLHGGIDKRLLRGLQDREQAAYIARELSSASICASPSRNVG